MCHLVLNIFEFIFSNLVTVHQLLVNVQLLSPKLKELSGLNVRQGAKVLKGQQKKKVSCFPVFRTALKHFAFLALVKSNYLFHRQRETTHHRS